MELYAIAIAALLAFRGCLGRAHAKGKHRACIQRELQASPSCFESVRHVIS